VFEEILARLAAALERHGIPSMVIGGQAVLLYGEPRLTRDIDVTLGVGTDRLASVLKLLPEIPLRPLPPDLEVFVQRTMVLPALHEATGVRVDLIFSFTPYEQEAIARARGVLAVSFIEAGQYYTYGSVELFLVKYMTDVSNMNGLLQSIILFSLVITVVFSKPLVGRLSDKAGRRTPIVLGCTVSLVPLVFIPFFTQFSALLALAIAYGVGFSMVTSVTSAFVSELVPLKIVGGAMGFIGTLMDVGQFLGPIFCGLILSTFLGYVGVFYSLALVLLITVATFALITASKPTGDDDA